MRLTTSMFLTAAALTMAGCSSVLSLEPVATPADARVVPGLAGTWASEGDVMSIREAPGNTYIVRFEQTEYVARTFRSGAGEYFEVTPKEEKPLHVRGHAIVRFWFNGSELRWAYLDSDWLKERTREHGLAFARSGESVILTGPAEGLRKVLGLHGQDDRAYDEVNVMRRVR